MKGQASIEFVTVIAAVLVIFAGFTITQLVHPALNVSRDTQQVGQARVASDRIARAINGVYSGAEGGAITEMIEFPSSSKLVLGRDNVEVRAMVDGGERWVSSDLKYGFRGDEGDLSEEIPGGNYAVIVQWENTEGLELEENRIYIDINPGDSNE